MGKPNPNFTLKNEEVTNMNIKRGKSETGTR